MKMQMVKDAGSGHLTEIHAHVKAHGMERPFKNLETKTQVGEDIGHFFPIEFPDFPDMPDGGNQKMGIGVRVSIQHHDGIRTAVNDETTPIGFMISRAKNTFLHFFGRQNVIHAPWGKQQFHVGDSLGRSEPNDLPGDLVTDLQNSNAPFSLRPPCAKGPGVE